MQLESLHDFDVFKVAKASSGRPLETVSMALIQRYALIEKLALPPVKLASFLRVPHALLPHPQNPTPMQHPCTMNIHVHNCACA